MVPDGNHDAAAYGIRLVAAVVQRWVSGVVLLALNALVLSVLMPYHPLVLIAVIICATLSALSFAAGRRRFGMSRKRLYGAAVIIAIIGVLVGCFGPIVALPWPVYVYLPAEKSLTKSTIIRTNADKGPSVVVFADPLRQLMKPLWQSFGRYRVRVLEHDEKNSTLIAFPMHAGYVVEEKLPAGVSVRNVDIITLTPPFSMSVRANYPLSRKSPGSFWTGFAFSASSVSEIDSVAVQGPRWNTVAVSAPATSVELRYIAALDDGITTLTYGSSGDALSKFESTLALAPSTIERVRIICLMARTVSAIVIGDLGYLQSLPVYNAAYSILVAGLEQHVVSPGDPISAWAATTIIAAYGTLRPYAERVNRLKRLEPSATLPPQVKVSRRQRDMFSGFAALADRSRNEKLTRDQAFGALRRFLEADRLTLGASLKNSFGDQAIDIASMSDDVFANALAAVRNDEDHAFWFGSEAALGVAVQMITGEWENGRRRLPLLADLATHMNRAVQEPFLERLETTSAYLQFMALASREDGAIGSLPEPRDPLRIPCYSLTRRLAAFSLAHPDWPEDSPPPRELVPTPKPLPDTVRNWWDPRFLDGVCERTFAMTLALAAAGPKGSGAHLTGSTVREAIGDPATVMRDQHGRPFLPWIAFVARFLEAEGGADFDDLRTRIEKETEGDYRQLVVSTTEDERRVLDDLLHATPERSR